MDWRSKTNFTIARLPKDFQEEKRLKCTPCNSCNQLVLASSTETERYKNDVKGFVISKSSPSDTIAFTMEKNGIVIPNLGYTPTFPNDSLAVGYVFDFKQILITNGIGCYTVKANFTIAGITSEFTKGVFTLKEYSVNSARRTVKIDSEFNSMDTPDNVDFTGSDFRDTLRFNGTFGKRQPKTEIDQLVSVGYKVEKVKQENLNQYTLQTDPINVCMTRQLVDFHLLHADKILISDHNPRNHSYLYLDFSVMMSEEPKFTYLEGDRRAKLEVLFKDKVLNSTSFYNKQ